MNILKAQLSMCDFGKLQLNTQNLNSAPGNGKFKFGGLWVMLHEKCEIIEKFNFEIKSMTAVYYLTSCIEIRPSPSWSKSLQKSSTDLV